MFVPCTPVDVPPVDAPRRRCSTRSIECSVIQLLVRDEVRIGRDDAADALLRHHGRRRAPGRGRPRRRRSRAAGRPARRGSPRRPVDFVELAVVCEGVARPATPLTRSCSASIRCVVLVAERAGRVKLCAGGDVLPLLIGDPAQLRRSRSRDLGAGRRQRVRDRGAVVLGAARDRRDLRPCSLSSGRASTSPRTTGSASPKKTSTATSDRDSAEQPQERRQPARRAGRPAHPGAAAAAARQPDPRWRRCVSVVAGSSSKKSKWMSSSRGSIAGRIYRVRSPAGEEMSWRRRRNREGVLGRARARPLPRPLPAAAPARLGRHGSRLARPRRAERPRRRTEDRRPRGQVAATGPSARRAPPPRCAIRAASGSSRSRATRRTSTSPTSTSPAARCARRCAPASSTTARAIEVAAQISEALAHAHGKRDRPPRREAVERAAGRGASRASTCGCSTSGSRRWPSSTR